MSESKLSDEEFLRRLNGHPELRERFGSLLLAVADETGALREADAAELRLIEEIRLMGRDSLTAWAQEQVVRTSREVCQGGSVWREGKKNCAGTVRSVK